MILSPIKKIAFRRVKRDIGKSLFIMLSVLLSVTAVSFLIFFRSGILAALSSFKDLPFEDFAKQLIAATDITVICLFALTLLYLRCNCSMKSEDNSTLMATLTSIGATGAQKRTVLLWDILYIYPAPVTIGALIGGAFGIVFGRTIGSEAKLFDLFQYLTSVFLIILLAMLFILLCNLIPSFKSGHRSVIQSVKRQNQEISNVRHGYRQSRTYKKQALYKRLAKKSCDYYSGMYNRISLSFVCSALYPVLAIILFLSIAKTEVVIDTNLHDGIDTSEAVIAAIDGIATFLGCCFAALGGIGTVQAVFMTRIQLSERKKAANVYLSVGMPREDIKRMIGREIVGVVFKTAVAVVFAAVFLNAVYSLFL